MIGVFESKLKTIQVFAIEPVTGMNRRHWAAFYSPRTPYAGRSDMETTNYEDTEYLYNRPS